MLSSLLYPHHTIIVHLKMRATRAHKISRVFFNVDICCTEKYNCEYSWSHYLPGTGTIDYVPFLSVNAGWYEIVIDITVLTCD